MLKILVHTYDLMTMTGMRANNTKITMAALACNKTVWRI